ncbi:alpha/beta hydrolase [Gaiella sp.]|jgi:acetyl esterase/lipase|uniref:alpha/beta hydrolase n=1 Tax=Gaiella sp. TaxID=2663207 RepID=UPI002E368AA0|nr:alpha/beta hydrolase [Gaiella sp.]HEX5583009.1 alpha/beta hydrolase [Gaiella sp.]
MIDASVGIDPEIVAAMEAAGMPPGIEGPPPSLELLEEMRAQPPRVPFDPAPAPGVHREERRVPGAAGTPDVPIRIHRPAEPVAAAAGIVWLHGGGLVLASYDADAAFLDRLVAATGCVAVSVDYRLAPETPYPGAIDDAFGGLAFLHESADELGVDAARLVVGGFSAGGGLAAACALRARDEGIRLVHQHLIYAMLDDRQSTPSSRWDMLAGWPRELNTFAWRCYLGELYGTDDVPAYAAPARADDLVGLAPAYIHVGGLDGFVHENLDYASRLIDAGVPTELHVFPGAPHGFDFFAPEAALSINANAVSEAALSRVLGS